MNLVSSAERSAAGADATAADATAIGRCILVNRGVDDAHHLDGDEDCAENVPENGQRKASRYA